MMRTAERLDGDVWRAFVTFATWRDVTGYTTASEAAGVSLARASDAVAHAVLLTVEYAGTGLRVHVIPRRGLFPTRLVNMTASESASPAPAVPTLSALVDEDAHAVTFTFVGRRGAVGRREVQPAAVRAAISTARGRVDDALAAVRHAVGGPGALSRVDDTLKAAAITASAKRSSHDSAAPPQQVRLKPYSPAPLSQPRDGGDAAVKEQPKDATVSVAADGAGTKYNTAHPDMFGTEVHNDERDVVVSCAPRDESMTITSIDAAQAPTLESPRVPMSSVESTTTDLLPAPVIFKLDLNTPEEVRATRATATHGTHALSQPKMRLMDARDNVTPSAVVHGATGPRAALDGSQVAKVSTLARKTVEPAAAAAAAAAELESEPSSSSGPPWLLALSSSSSKSTAPTPDTVAKGRRHATPARVITNNRARSAARSLLRGDDTLAAAHDTLPQRTSIVASAAMIATPRRAVSVPPLNIVRDPHAMRGTVASAKPAFMGAQTPAGEPRRHRGRVIVARRTAAHLRSPPQIVTPVRPDADAGRVGVLAATASHHVLLHGGSGVLRRAEHGADNEDLPVPPSVRHVRSAAWTVSLEPPSAAKPVMSADGMYRGRGSGLKPERVHRRRAVSAMPPARGAGKSVSKAMSSEISPSTRDAVAPIATLLTTSAASPVVVSVSLLEPPHSAAHAFAGRRTTAAVGLLNEQVDERSASPVPNLSSQMLRQTMSTVHPHVTVSPHRRARSIDNGVARRISGDVLSPALASPSSAATPGGSALQYAADAEFDIIQSPKRRAFAAPLAAPRARSPSLVQRVAAAKAHRDAASAAGAGLSPSSAVSAARQRAAVAIAAAAEARDAVLASTIAAHSTTSTLTHKPPNNSVKAAHQAVHGSLLRPLDMTTPASPSPQRRGRDVQPNPGTAVVVNRFVRTLDRAVSPSKAGSPRLTSSATSAVVPNLPLKWVAGRAQPSGSTPSPPRGSTDGPVSTAVNTTVKDRRGSLQASLGAWYAGLRNGGAAIGLASSRLTSEDRTSVAMPQRRSFSQVRSARTPATSIHLRGATGAIPLSTPLTAPSPAPLSPLLLRRRGSWGTPDVRVGDASLPSSTYRSGIVGAPLSHAFAPHERVGMSPSPSSRGLRESPQRHSVDRAPMQMETGILLPGLSPLGRLQAADVEQLSSAVDAIAHLVAAGLQPRHPRNETDSTTSPGLILALLGAVAGCGTALVATGSARAELVATLGRAASTLVAVQRLQKQQSRPSSSIILHRFHQTISQDNGTVSSTNDSDRNVRSSRARLSPFVEYAAALRALRTSALPLSAAARQEAADYERVAAQMASKADTAVQEAVHRGGRASS